MSPHTSHRLPHLRAGGERGEVKSARLGVSYSTRHAHDVTLMWSLRTQECCKWVGWVECDTLKCVSTLHALCALSWVRSTLDTLACQVSSNRTQVCNTLHDLLKRFINFEKLAHEKFWNAQARTQWLASHTLSKHFVLCFKCAQHYCTAIIKDLLTACLPSHAFYSLLLIISANNLCAWVPVRTDESKRMKSFRWVRTQRTPTRRLCGHNTLRTVWNTNMGVYLRSEAVSIDSLSCIKQELRLIGLFKPLEA
jgi:hypothetical protein